MAVVTIHAIPAQSRTADSFQSPTATYDGTAGLTAEARLVDPNWKTTTPPALQVTLSGQENFNLSAQPNDPGWLAFSGPATWSPPVAGKGGALPSISTTMPSGGDGKGQRLVRLNLTINQTWGGGVDLLLG